MRQGRNDGGRDAEIVQRKDGEVHDLRKNSFVSLEALKIKMVHVRTICDCSEVEFFFFFIPQMKEKMESDSQS